MRSRWIAGAALVLAVTLSLVQSVPVDKQAAISSSFRSTEPKPPSPPINGVYVPNFPPAETAIPNATNISFDKTVNKITRSSVGAQRGTKGKVAALTDSAKTIAAPTLAYADLVKGRASSLHKEFHKGLLGQRLVHFAHTYGLQLNPFTQPLGAMSRVGREKRRVWVWQIVDIPSIQKNEGNPAFTKLVNATTLIRFSFSAFANLEEYLLVDILPVGANSSSTRSCLSGMLQATKGAHTVGLVLKLKGELIPKSCPFERSALLQIFERFVLRVFGARRNFVVDKQTTSFPYTKHQLFVSFAKNFIPSIDEKDVVAKLGYTPRAWNNCSVDGSQRAADILRCTTVEYLEYFLTTLNSTRAAVLREELISTLPVDPASVGLRPLAITNTNVLSTPQCRGHQPLSWVITSWLQDIKALLSTDNDMLGPEQIGAVQVTVKKIHRVYRLLQLIQELQQGPRLYTTLTSVNACAHKEKRADWF